MILGTQLSIIRMGNTGIKFPIRLVINTGNQCKLRPIIPKGIPKRSSPIGSIEATNTCKRGEKDNSHILIPPNK